VRGGYPGSVRTRVLIRTWSWGGMSDQGFSAQRGITSPVHQRAYSPLFRTLDEGLRPPTAWTPPRVRTACMPTLDWDRLLSPPVRSAPIRLAALSSVIEQVWTPMVSSRAPHPGLYPSAPRGPLKRTARC